MTQSPAHRFTAVNDTHSALNPTLVAGVVQPLSIEDISSALRATADAGQPVSICGARHAMGAQQFGTGALLIDTSRFDRVVAFDATRG
ncbi:MAG TPA: FAD-binding protein, partial [Burkholderiales bacterium]|nr:FAD-binding protein [Burkholderiales bacterium]